uniref:Uncharacterized protein n=1 Tax=Arundo donax TaxID=35708 RepID=A0A0A8ZGL7_ARUDO
MVNGHVSFLSLHASPLSYTHKVAMRALVAHDSGPVISSLPY